MAQSSKRVKRERRERRKQTLLKVAPVLQNNWQLRQELARLQDFVQRASQEALIARNLLLGVIAQQGGNIEVTKGTLDQVRANLQTLSWKVEPKKDDATTFVITMVEGQTTAEEAAPAEDPEDENPVQRDEPAEQTAINASINAAL